MKIRKQVRHLYRALTVEVSNWFRDNHACRDYMIDGNGDCVGCNLDSTQKAFALIQLIRDRGLHLEWFHAERNLYDLLGEKAFVNKFEMEMKEVSNFPRKTCECGSVVTLYTRFSELARQIKKTGYLDHICLRCNQRVRFMAEEFPDLPPYKGPQIRPEHAERPRFRRGARGVNPMPPGNFDGPPAAPPQLIEEILQRGEAIIEAQDNMVNMQVNPPAPAPEQPERNLVLREAHVPRRRRP